ncbi:MULTISPECIES: Gfo/Idh/MocA family protein [unclassified Sphingomonas]|uniref:Gfo/Idh/MocA family protein n=1 Tax=unclassified Sphingomonas TaxID=196159 RepID=UPI0002EFF40C|nr:MULTISPECIES: Gfo/Idh/MocA family oxidoreductase [unclassified Sphingomonas]KTF67807.1 galactose 1-dehydrogenase [Sphingomonas sp. WG]
MPAPIRIAIVGLGKIAHDQHLPSIAANAAFQLAATVSSRDETVDGLPHFRTLAALLAADVAIDAVSLCTPPQVRYALVVEAMAAGKHVFLEKPPGATLAEVALLDQQAEAAGVTLFASWHSRYAGGVAPALHWLDGRRITRASIVWREDVRVWHPGQDWIWQPGGLGVFDPGINALSIATHLLPPFFLQEATLALPANRAAPIAADLRFQTGDGTPVHMDLDWRQTGPQRWDIAIETDGGTLTLEKGGAVLTTPEGVQAHDDVEYAGLYARFAALVQSRARDVDTAPLRLVADAFLRGRRETVDAFHD